MGSINLDQDKQRFAEWRSQRQGRQLIPDELWQVACNHISTLGITRVAREFHLSDSKLRKKAIEAGIVLPRLGKRKISRPRKTGFREISLDRMFVPPTPSIVLERPDGMRVRIEGQLPNAEYVSKLAACFLK